MAWYFHWRGTKERVCIVRCLKLVLELGEVTSSPRSETQLSFQLKSVGAGEARRLWKARHLASVKGGENKWESIFSSNWYHQCYSAGAWDLLPAAPVPPALCFGFVQLQFHIIWGKVWKSLLCVFCLLGETITMRVGRSNVKALLRMCHVIYH